MAPKPYFPTIRDAPSSPVRRLLDGFLNLIYPEECLLCSIAVARHQDCGICGRCWSKALEMKIAPPQCASCGLPLHNFEDNRDHLCGGCILQLPPFAGARSFGYYSGELGRIVQGLKFHGRANLAELLGPLLISTFFEFWGREEFDLVVPVPLHPERRRERGYNQSELLARSLARGIALPLRSALVRTRPTPPQVGLTDTERRENVRKAFSCPRPQSVAGKRIILIDDVMTTGATVASATRALLDGGALRVSVLTVARAGKG